MLIDTNDIINSKKIEITIEMKSGKKIDYILNCSEVKSIDLKIIEKEYRKSIWDSNNNDKSEEIKIN